MAAVRAISPLSDCGAGSSRCYRQHEPFRCGGVRSGAGANFTAARETSGPNKSETSRRARDRLLGLLSRIRHCRLARAVSLDYIKTRDP